MVRGRNTNGMVGFTAFFPAGSAERPSVMNAHFCDHTAVVCKRDSIINRLSEQDKSVFIGRHLWCAIHGQNKFHRLNVRLAGLCEGGSGIKSLQLFSSTIFPVFIGCGSEKVNARRTSLIFEEENAGCVRGPP